MNRGMMCVMLLENRLVLKAAADGLQLSRTQGQWGFPPLLTPEESALGQRTLQEAVARTAISWKSLALRLMPGGVAVLPLTLTLLRRLYLCYLLQEAVELFNTMLSENAVVEQVSSHPSQWNQPIYVLELPCLWLSNVHLSSSLRHSVKGSQQGDLWESFINNNRWKKDRNLFTKME